MDIIMPKMGESVNEGTIIKWHKKVGDTVKRDEIIFEISTDKVDTEIPAAESGILSEILVKEGDTVEVGSVVARIKTSDEPDKEIPAPEVKSQTVTQSPPEPVKKTEDIPKEIPSSSKGNLIEIAMPKMGESIVEGTIIKWHKKVGDAVKKDETIFEISTDKVDTEVPSPADGILEEILFNENETVAVDTIVAKIKTTSGLVPILNEKSIEQRVVVEIDKANEPIINNKESFKKDEQNKFFSPLVLNIAKKKIFFYQN